MTIALTAHVSEVPKKLPPHDFGFDIDYRSDEGPAKRVFGATYRFMKHARHAVTHFWDLLES